MAALDVSLGKDLVGWLDGANLLFTQAEGTAVASLYLLAISQDPLPALERTGLVASAFYVSVDQDWLAANAVGSDCPEARVVDLSSRPFGFSLPFPGQCSLAQCWIGDTLAAVVYPRGKRDDWKAHNLYLQEMTSSRSRLLAQGALRAFAAPTGGSLAVLFFGEPVQEGEVLETRGEQVYLGILDSPSERLLASYPLSDASPAGPSIPVPGDPAWSPDGRWLAFPGSEQGLLLLGRDGRVQPVLTARKVDWVGWGSDGYLAMLIDERVWLLHLPPDKE